MNKAELTSAVATKLDVPKTEASRIIEAVLGEIIAGATTTGECLVPGLGKLKVRETAAKTGTTGGKAWSKPAGKKIALTLSKEGKALV